MGDSSVQVRSGTLADMLARGPLPLSDALKYAVPLAWQLRDLHASGSAHGKVSTLSVVFAANRVELLPARAFFDETEPADDIRGWGTVLFEMLTGARPPAVENVPPRPGGSRTGPSTVRPL